MGNTSTRGPKLEKFTQNGSTNYLRYGVCEMQGWRSSMEDATIAAVDFDVNTSLFGVMDGHGGSTISKFMSCNFVNLLTHMKSYKQKNYEQALIETYLKFDELLRLQKVNQFLRQNSASRKESRLDITFSYGIQPELASDPKYYEADVVKAEEERNREEDVPMTSQKSKGKENSNESPRHAKSSQAYIPKENIIDLTKKESLSSKGSPNSKNQSNEDSKTRSNEILTMDSKKIEISLKNSQNSDNYDELVAKDMGTTANILLIKNNYLYLANVGDSMAVIFKNGVATRLNQEHKTTLPSEFTRISKSGARIINNRIEGRLNLTRAIGDLNFKNNQNLKFYEQAVTAYPEITKMKITKDIDFVIMACDGVWDCVDVQKLCEHISIKLKSRMKMSDILAELFDQIISKTNNTPVGTDNMSCILIQFLHD